MNKPSIELRPASPEGFAAVVLLLKACGLTHADLTPAHMPDFVLAWLGEAPVGVAGFERVDALGLLRSVAVLQEYRNSGLARRLVEACETRASAQGIRVLFLIAMDDRAANFFAHLAYEAVTREEVPSGLKALPEFSHLCPKANPCLRKALNPENGEAPR